MVGRATAAWSPEMAGRLPARGRAPRKALALPAWAHRHPAAAAARRHHEPATGSPAQELDVGCHDWPRDATFDRIVDRYGDYLFTSESVSEGHPCNQISDAVVDAALTGDPAGRVPLPEIRHHRLIVVGGEISTRSSVNPQQLTRDVLREAGYDAPILGIDFRTCYGAQHDACPSRPSSPAAWTAGLHKVQGAGDQGMVVGYACSAPPAPDAVADPIRPRHHTAGSTRTEERPLAGSRSPTASARHRSATPMASLFHLRTSVS